MVENKRLYRSLSNRVFGGVAGGLGEYFAMDPVIIRAIFVLLAIFGGGGLIIYIVLWIALQEKGANQKSSEVPFETSHFQNEMDSQPTFNRSKASFSLLIAIILIGIGVTLLIDRSLFTIVFRQFWPLLLIVVGVFMLIRSFEHKK